MGMYLGTTEQMVKNEDNPSGLGCTRTGPDWQERIEQIG